MFDFDIFCHLLTTGGDISGRDPRLVISKVLFSLLFSSFSFFLFFFSILHFLSFFVSLSGAPLAPGPMDIVHPCHPVATPLIFVYYTPTTLICFFDKRMIWIFGFLSTFFIPHKITVPLAWCAFLCVAGSDTICIF